jgi:hypothetical protein
VLGSPKGTVTPATFSAGARKLGNVSAGALVVLTVACAVPPTLGLLSLPTSGGGLTRDLRHCPARSGAGNVTRAARPLHKFRQIRVLALER